MSTDATQGSIYSAPESETGTTGSDDLLAAYVGPKRAEYYKARFDRFLGGGGSIGWHWPAFFFTAAWLLYRKMWLFALLYIFVVPIALSMITVTVLDPVTAVTAYYLIYGIYGFILMPLFANRLYYGHVRSKVDKISSLNMSDGQMAEELARKGGTSWLGFIFIIIPIIGILAAIVIPAYSDYSTRAQVSEGLSLAGGAKTAVAEFYGDNQRMPADNAEAGLSEATAIYGKFVESVRVVDGDIYIEYGGDEASPIIVGRTLVLEAEPPRETSSRLTWNCFSSGIPARHLPAACRQ